MTWAYLAALLPLAWGALFLWALRQPNARRVKRPLTQAEIAERVDEAARQFAASLNISIVAATQQMTAAMNEMARAFAKLASVLQEAPRRE